MKVREAPVLHSARCDLVLLCPENVALLVDYRQRNLQHFAPWEPLPDPQDATLLASCERAAARAAQGFADGQSVQFIAIERQTQTMVAGCNFTNIVRGPLQACHLGYSVDQVWQGKGLMREVVVAGIDYMFTAQGLHRIMANHMPSNQRSAKLLQALGFEREGYARDYLRIAGRWEDMVLNALLCPPA